jgi:hypothetical protein
MDFFNKYTAYTDDEENCLGLVEMYSNIRDLLNYSVDSSHNSYSAEINFLEKDYSCLINSSQIINLILRKDNRSQACELWKLTGTTNVIPVADNKLSVYLSKIVYYFDGDEHIFWDAFKLIHRIRGVDYIK